MPLVWWWYENALVASWFQIQSRGMLIWLETQLHGQKNYIVMQVTIVCRSVEGNVIVNSKQIAVMHVRIVLLLFLWFEVCGKAFGFKLGCKIQQCLSNVGTELPAIEWQCKGEREEHSECNKLQMPLHSLSCGFIYGGASVTSWWQ